MIGSTDYLALHARLQPCAPAAQDLASGRSWTYEAFDRAASQYAGLLRERGVVAGDRVAVLARNRVELILMHLGCARLGAMYVPLNWRLSRAEILGLIDDAEPRLLLGDAMLAQLDLSGGPLDEFAAAAEAVVAADFPRPMIRQPR